MTSVALVQGSPSKRSKTAAVMGVVEQMLESAGLRTKRVDVRSMPFDALASADLANFEIHSAVSAVVSSDAVVIATPVYKAAYTGLLKTFLDLLPQDALHDTTVLPIATGGSFGHLLAIDYALKPVLTALGARTFVSSVYLLDQAIRVDQTSVQMDEAEHQRLVASVEELVQAVARRRQTAVV
ncbi:NADPH-dependent FMN reductase [Alicyclobacillus mali]|uniref:NADPH-dependent FMN reductase n=1 Tax=Alicyclobacillus mali (ex Roth et al. 2021) TaxID=1123961 RepID=A0ABS0F215_9BACL|nr:NADPH-dependent FMN reductase [Alicyclobacillus mali (ex Roth et al. 2021)]MBF8377327.1 NADPH-dependent FMN reductase [Alicyclobacillus mali (ex Roth et al. 2021)]